MSKETTKSGGARKYGRNRRTKDQAISLYIKNRISFEKYQKTKA